MKDNANPCDSGRFRCETCPRAAPENQITGTQYRFTVLTPRLIRMEYAPSGAFEDRASQTVFFRDFPACTFQAERKDGLLTVNTGELLLTYRENEPFSPDTLCLRLLHEPGAFWHYGEDYEDLGGTAETLDGIDGAVPIGRGVCSMHGFSVLDDSHTMLLNAEGWVEVRPARTLDVYFFGYGFSYRDAVRDFYRLTGAPAMLPAYAMGNWWSRYYPYTQDEYLALMDRFREEDIPFSVGVVDMDWHIVNISEELRDDTENWQTKWRPGWTGYTWNATLFPDHRAFLQGLHKRNLKTALCLHPASGVRRHEVQYAEMAKRLGVQNGQRIPFDILSPKYMALYFDVLHHPYEADGVDFWWLDWQQGKDYKWIHEITGDPLDARECLDPLWMLNHLHTLDISRTGKRPMLFSRYAGPGSHRYAIGFSGDSGVSWESLRFQPYFTAAASNIGYCWWSHDIGGHYGGYRDDELTLDWGTEACFTIHPAQGERSLIPAVRCWEIQFTGFHRDAAVSALVGERAAEVCPVYDPAQNTLTVTITAPVTARIHLLISGPSLMHDNADRMERCMTLLQSYQAAHSRKQRLLDVLRSLDPGIKPEKLPFRLAPESPEDSHFIRALVELLTLTAD